MLVYGGFVIGCFGSYMTYDAIERSDARRLWRLALPLLAAGVVLLAIGLLVTVLG